MFFVFLSVIVAKMADEMHKYTVLGLENDVDKTALLVENMNINISFLILYFSDIRVWLFCFFIPDVFYGSLLVFFVLSRGEIVFRLFFMAYFCSFFLKFFNVFYVSFCPVFYSLLLVFYYFLGGDR